MVSVLALASCTHDADFYSLEKNEAAIRESYAQAFENTFGKVGSGENN